MTIATASNNTPTVIVSESGQQGVKGVDGTNGTGFNSVRKALLDNPLCHLFKTNKLLDTLSGALTSTRATTGTYVDRYGVVKTAAINTMREEKDGWLIEGASTNLALHSEAFDDAVWTATTSTITANTTTAPDNNLTADTLAVTAANSKVDQSITFLASTYTLSVWIKKISGFGDFRLSIFDGTTQTLSVNSTATTEWVRHKLTVSVSAGNGSVAILNESGGNVSSFAIWGAQLEVKPFTTSYMSTTTAAVTRAADIINLVYNNNHPDLINKSELSYFINCSLLGTDTAKFPVIVEANNYQYSLLRIDNSNSLVYLRNNTPLKSATIDATIKFSASVSLTLDTASLYLNGVLSGSLTSTPLTELLPTVLNIGSGTGNQLYGHISDLRIYDFALNQEEITYLSGV